MASDPDHTGQDADAWITPPGEFLTFYDNHGHRMWIRIEKVLRVSIQHDQDMPRKPLVGLMYKSFSWLQTTARSSGFTEIIFESRAMRLIAFLNKLFGVSPVKENFHVRT